MTTLALDIGGANIKAAHSDGRTWSVPFALWKQPEQLAACLREQFSQTAIADELLVTMTGELCDCFETRTEGVTHILDAASEWAGNTPLHVWSITHDGFVPADIARKQPLAVASGNWHALATYQARTHSTVSGLMIDIGSTTTDLIRLEQGNVQAIGTTDRDRLASRELVYTGVHRTPIAAVTQRVQLQSQTFGVAAEAFAFMSDVYTLLQYIPESSTDTDTADDRPRTNQCCANRLLRMIGSDLAMNDESDARELANVFADTQRDQIVDAAQQVITQNASSNDTFSCDHFFLSGSGEFLAKRVADRLNSNAAKTKLSDSASPQASTAACAYALLQLNRESQHHV